MPDLHLFWQGEMFTLEKFTNIRSYIVSDGNEVVAALSLKDSGLINFIWVRPDKRQQGYARELLYYGLSMLEHNNLYAIASNNFMYEGFLSNLGFQKRYRTIRNDAYSQEVNWMNNYKTIEHLLHIQRILMTISRYLFAYPMTIMVRH